jgi:hypothetical protein
MGFWNPFEGCGPLMHTWDYGVDPGELNGGCMVTNTILYTCLACGKTRRGYWA